MLIFRKHDFNPNGTLPGFKDGKTASKSNYKYYLNKIAFKK